MFPGTSVISDDCPSFDCPLRGIFLQFVSIAEAPFVPAWIDLVKVNTFLGTRSQNKLLAGRNVISGT